MFTLTNNKIHGKLEKFHKITEDNARIIAESTDPYNSIDPSYLQYLESNKKRGRMPGQLRLRVRYGGLRDSVV